MTKLILARRRFLFAAPAIVAASSLMPGHSIAKLLAPPLRQFLWIEHDPISAALRLDRPLLFGVPVSHGDMSVYDPRSIVQLTEAETLDYVRKDPALFYGGVPWLYYSRTREP